MRDPFFSRGSLPVVTAPVQWEYNAIPAFAEVKGDSLWEAHVQNLNYADDE